jgi:ABC-type antimicrobial peptide transport system permease subunit
VVAPLRNQLQAMQPGMPFVHLLPLDDRARPARIQWEVAATLFTVFGMLATLLAGVGLYMVVAFMITQRTRELGVRSALGSSRAAIVRLVLARSARMSGAGIIAGTACALAAARLLANRLYGVAATDVVVYVAAAVLLVIVTLIASWLPARAAARQDPVSVLRHE